MKPPARLQLTLTKSAPLLIFLLLAGLSYWVWHLQVQSQRQLVQQHTEEVCQQVIRRIQVLVESRIDMLSMVAKHIVNRPQKALSAHYPEEMTQEFSALLKNTPGLHLLRLVLPQDGQEWIYPQSRTSAWPQLGKARSLLLAAARRQKTMVLSSPVLDGRGRSTFFAVLPLRQEQSPQAYLVFELLSQTLISASFAHRVRAEFNLQITDGAAVLFQFRTKGSHSSVPPPILAQHHFTVRNRRWLAQVIPLNAREILALWNPNLLVLLLGGLLSLSLAWVVHLLARRMQLYRSAHRQALDEIAAREKAQQAMRVSEARYRGIFTSATDGLLVLDEQGTIVEANPAACTMHGYAPDELVGLTVKVLFSPEHQHLSEEFNRQLKHFGSARLDALDQRRTGELLDVELRGSRFSYGNQPLRLAIITDVSERKLAVRQHALLSRKVLMAQEEERARLSRELHDELGQILTAIHLELSWLVKKRGPQRCEEASSLENTVQLVEKAADELRHICRGLRPPLLDDLGLEPAIRLLIEEFQERTKLKIDLDIRLDETKPGIAPELALATYRILQEALHNISRHAAASEVSLSLLDREAELVLSVYDNGRGFEVDKLEGGKGCGIAGMRERAHLVNGIIDIRAEAFQGTRVVFSAPAHHTKREGNHDQNPGG